LIQYNEPHRAEEYLEIKLWPDISNSKPELLFSKGVP